MSIPYFIGDMHLGHRNVCKYRTQFATREMHDETLLINFNSIVRKRDHTYFLGDICFTPEALEMISTLNGSKILILGNHDTQSGTPSMSDLCQVFSGGVHSLMKYKEFWLSHAPIHPSELRGKVNIHGHVHSNTVRDMRYFNASCENIRMTPISLYEIRKIMNRRSAGDFSSEYMELGREVAAVREGK